MAPPKKPWFRMYCEITGDRKLRGMPADQRWVWVAVMVLARTSPLPGFLMVSDAVACSEEAIADEAATPIAKTRAALRAMSDLGMIHRDDNLGCWAVTNWERRQFESDDTTARTRKHRQQATDATTMERSGNADGTHQKQKAEAEAEITNSQQQHESVPADPRAAAAIGIQVEQAVAAGRTTTPDALQRHIEATQGDALVDWLSTRPEASAMDAAVAVLGSTRPPTTKTFVRVEETLPCGPCKATGTIEDRKTKQPKPCPWCNASGHRTEHRTEEIAQ